MLNGLEMFYTSSERFKKIYSELEDHKKKHFMIKLSESTN